MAWASVSMSNPESTSTRADAFKASLASRAANGPCLKHTLRQLARANLQLTRGGHRGHETDVQCLLRVDDVAGEDEMLGPAETHDTRQTLGRARARNDAEAELRLTECRGL